MSRPAAGLALACTGPIAALDRDARARLLGRRGRIPEEVRAAAVAIVERVRRGGDAALLELARELERVEPLGLEVPRPVVEAALAGLEPQLRAALERAARNIEAWHRALAPRAAEIETEPGVRVGRRPDPFARVGIYAPGGRAAYPSSVLMAAIPARVAGVGEIVLCSPPGPGGRPAPAVLAAAALAGVDRVFALGGAAAIAALACGTRSVPRVDAIAGPGNAWVAAAKLAVAGEVAIDSPAGPSELLVLADGTCAPGPIARELLAQAEHDPAAVALAVAFGPGAARHAAAIHEALAAALDGEPRREVIEAALAGQGGLLTAPTLEEALEFAADFAPEHLLLALERPEQVLPRVRHAGAVFLGASSSVAFGDYLTGANHTLPTGGAARSWSGLSTLDFVRWTGTQSVTPAAAAALAADTARLARAEGLPAHAAAAECWRGGAAETARAAAGAADAKRGVPAPARPAYRDLPLYRPDLSPCAIQLADNTNRFGAPPAALRVLREAALPEVTRYPEPFADALQRALAGYAGVSPEAIATGCGADDVIDSAIRAFAEPGDVLAYPEPTFGMAPHFARMNGLRPLAVPRRADLGLDPEALLAAGARILYICSPDNPTGARAADAALERIFARAATPPRRGEAPPPALVILDEAYAEFAGGAGWIGRAPGLERVLVVRTLSKAFGLAGLRVGWAAGPPDTVREVEKSRGPFKVGALAARAAVAALTEDLAWMRREVERAVEARARLVAALLERGFRPLPSEANFVLVPVRDAAGTAAAMRRAGVAVRPFPALPAIGDAVRITVAPWPELEAALGALAEAAR